MLQSRFRIPGNIFAWRLRIQMHIKMWVAEIRWQMMAGKSQGQCCCSGVGMGGEASCTSLGLLSQAVCEHPPAERPRSLGQMMAVRSLIPVSFFFGCFYLGRKTVLFFFFFLTLFFFFYLWWILSYIEMKQLSDIPHPDPPSHLPLHPLPLGFPSAPGPSACLMHPTWAGDLFHPR